MNKAEELAEQMFPEPQMENYDDILEYRNDRGWTIIARGAVVKGYEQAKQDFIEKACDAYCKVCGHYPHTTPDYICRQACDYYKDFRAYIKGE